MTMYACFIKTPSGMLPMGMHANRETAKGILISEMENIFAEFAAMNDGTLIAFQAEECIYDGDATKGFRIEGVAAEYSATKAAYISERDFGSNFCDDDRRHLTGYALAMEVE